MEEEEKKAVEYFKKSINEGVFWCYEAIPNIKTILNLIEKQQKEIEELKKYETYYEEQNEVNKKFIPKQKIIKFIKEGKIVGIENTEVILIEKKYFKELLEEE